MARSAKRPQCAYTPLTQELSCRILCRRGLEMNDGDKAKAKAAKAKTSGKETSSKNSAKEKGGKAVAASSKKESSAPSKTGAEKKGGSAKSSSAKAGGKSSGKARSEPDTITFTNPAIESAFNRAVKKYPNAFRRLTD